MISQKPETTNGKGYTIKVGATGTIGSLMSRELESMKEASQASSSTQKKPQSPPVSVPCGSTPRKSQLRRNSTSDSSSNSSTSSSNSSSGLNKVPPNAQKPKQNPWKNGHKVPMLGAEEVNADRMNNRDQKKANSYIVEVVDLKCSNPVSSRLKKLGFSKLSESAA